MTTARGDDAAPANVPAAKPAITRVTLHLQQAMPQDVFDELAKAGGVKFITNGGNFWDQNGLEGENDVDLADRPFWSAVNEVCGLWNLSVQSSAMYGNGNNPKHIQLINFSGRVEGAPKPQLPVFESDGFLVQANSFNRQQSINYARPEQSQNNCSVQLTVFVDPAIHILSMNQNVKVDEAVDDAGNSMITTRNNNMFYGGMQQRSMIYTCMAPLKYPDKPGKMIAHLKCTITLRGSDAMDTLSVDKPLAADETSKEFGDTTVVFHSLKKAANGMYEAKIGITRDEEQGGGNMWGVVQGAQLTDAKGRSFGSVGGGGGGMGPDGMAEYTINYMVNGQGDDGATGEPVKWSLELPTKSHSIKLPVEFKDLPMP